MDVRAVRLAIQIALQRLEVGPAVVGDKMIGAAIVGVFVGIIGTVVDEEVGYAVMVAGIVAVS